jgi:hypothetical protein
LKYLSLTFFSILAFSFNSLTFVHETPNNRKDCMQPKLRKMVPNVSLVIEKKESNKFLNPI